MGFSEKFKDERELGVDAAEGSSKRRLNGAVWFFQRSSLLRKKGHLRKMVYCLSWLRCFWSDLHCPNNLPEEKMFDILSLPDDIMVDILSRLPIETIVACREVCWRWHSLTSTRQFSEIHSRRVGASSVLFFQYELPHESVESTKWGDEHPVLYVEDFGPKLADAREVCTRDYKRDGNSPEFLASCNGFLLLKLYNMSMYVICNPVTLEGGLKLTWLPHQRVSIPGFFFDESTEEYMLFLSHGGKGFQDTHYSTYNLNTKELNPLGKMRYAPDVSGIRPAIYVDGLLFLMVEHQYRDGRSHPHCSKSIMMVKVKKNEDYFTLLPHPGGRCGFISSQEKHANMRFSMETNGRLLFTEMHTKAIHVWVLKDIGKWLWGKTYVVDLDRFEFRSFLCFGDPFLSDYEPRFLGIQNGELVLHWPHRGVYLYNLQLKIVRRIRGSQLPKDSSASSVYALSCTKTLASLRDLRAPSKISRCCGC